MTDSTPAQQRMAWARDIRRRKVDRQMAEDLRSRGWKAEEPDDPLRKRVDELLAATADAEGR